MEELIVRFRPSLEEYLLHTIKALHKKAVSQPNPGDGQDFIVGFSRTLARVSGKFFRTPAAPNKGHTDHAKKTADFNARYKAAFEDDFSLGARRAPLSLDTIVDALSKWEKFLQSRVSATPFSLPLQQASYSIVRLSNEAPDLWPGVCNPPALAKSGARRAKLPEAADLSRSSSAAHEGGWGHLWEWGQRRGDPWVLRPQLHQFR